MSKYAAITTSQKEETLCCVITFIFFTDKAVNVLGPSVLYHVFRVFQKFCNQIAFYIFQTKDRLISLIKEVS